MPETAPNPLTTPQHSPHTEEENTHLRGLQSRDFYSVQNDSPVSEVSQPKNDWDFGGVPEATEPAQTNAKVEHAPFLARQKVRLASGIGELAAGIRTANIEGISYKTNLPRKLSPFESTEKGQMALHPAERALLPSVIDDIPAGEYIVRKPVSNTWLKKDKIIIVTDEPDGKRINEIDVSGIIKQSGRPEKLMTALGYKFEENVLDAGTDDEVIRYGKLKAVPTPNTLHRKASELGVDIKFIPDQGQIDNPTYLQAFAERKYPVSLASADYYTHDTTDDHLTSMVLGAAPLKEALRTVAMRALKNEHSQSNIVEGIDEFTARLRLTIAYNGPHNLYSPNGLRTSGAKIGIDADTVDWILEVAQKNARKYDMKVMEHPVGS